MVRNIKVHRRQNKNYKRKRRSSMVKVVMNKMCLKRRNMETTRRKRKQIQILIQYNGSSKETLYPENKSLFVKQYSYYDDLNLNSTPKPLKHPFTKKSQFSVVLERSIEQTCKSPSLLQNWQSIVETRTQRQTGNDENTSLVQKTETLNNSPCLSPTRVIQSCRCTTWHHDWHDHGIMTACGENDNAASKINCSSDDDSNSDNECLKSHPNRRLVVEKTNYNIINGSVKMQESNKITEPVTNAKAKTDVLAHHTQNPLVDERSYKVSQMWLDILNAPDFWKTETFVNTHFCHKTLNFNSTSNKLADENTMHFEEMIDSLKKLKGKKSNNLYEDKFQDKLTDLDSKRLLADFYIPPAKLEILYSKLTSDMSQQECLAQLCTEMQWPQPTYTLVRSRNTPNVLFSCNLKTKSFLPKRPGQRINLNKELAAFECLNWLGFKPNSDTNANWASKKTVYYI